MAGANGAAADKFFLCQGQRRRVPSVLIRDLTDEMHRRLRVVAAFKGESLSAFGARAVEAEVERVEAEMEAELRRREGR